MCVVSTEWVRFTMVTGATNPHTDHCLREISNTTLYSTTTTQPLSALHTGHGAKKKIIDTRPNVKKKIQTENGIVFFEIGKV